MCPRSLLAGAGIQLAKWLGELIAAQTGGSAAYRQHEQLSRSVMRSSQHPWSAVGKIAGCWGVPWLRRCAMGFVCQSRVVYRRPVGRIWLQTPMVAGVTCKRDGPHGWKIALARVHARAREARLGIWEAGCGWCSFWASLDGMGA